MKYKKNKTGFSFLIVTLKQANIQILYSHSMQQS